MIDCNKVYAAALKTLQFTWRLPCLPRRFWLVCKHLPATHSSDTFFFFWKLYLLFLSFTTVFWLVREYWQISWCLLCSTERHYCYATSRNLQQSLANQSGNTHFPLATRVCQGAFNQSLNLCDWRLYSFKFKHNDIII